MLAQARPTPVAPTISAEGAAAPFEDGPHNNPELALTPFDRFLAFDTPPERVVVPQIGPDTQVAYILWRQSARWSEQLAYRMQQIVEETGRPISRIRVFSDGVPVLGKRPIEYEDLISREVAVRRDSSELARSLFADLTFEYGIDFHAPEQVRELDERIARYRSSFLAKEAIFDQDPRKFLRENPSLEAATAALIDPYRTMLVNQSALIAPDRHHHMFGQLQARFEDLAADEFAFVLTGLDHSALPFMHFQNPSLPAATFEYHGLPEGILGELAPEGTRYRYPGTYTSYLSMRMAAEGFEPSFSELKRGVVDSVAVLSVALLAQAAAETCGDQLARDELTNVGTLDFSARSLNCLEPDLYTRFFDGGLGSLLQTGPLARHYPSVTECMFYPLNDIFKQGFYRPADEEHAAAFMTFVAIMEKALNPSGRD
jgi:hypothetical protein